MRLGDGRLPVRGPAHRVGAAPNQTVQRIPPDVTAPALASLGKPGAAPSGSIADLGVRRQRESFPRADRASIFTTFGFRWRALARFPEALRDGVPP